jgi:excisionase family DNA binding protein
MMAGMMAQSKQHPQQQPSSGGGGSAPDVMTPAEAAAYLKVTEEEINQMITAGDIKAKKIGISFRIAKKTLDDFLSG